MSKTFASANIHRLLPDSTDIVDHFFTRIIAGLRCEGINQWDELYPDKKILERDLARGHAFGLSEKKTLIAYVALNNEYPPEYEKIPWKFRTPALIVHRLAIIPDRRRMGLGRAMMRFCEIYAYENGFHSIRLDAFENNPAALACYRNLEYFDRGTIMFRTGLFRCFEKAVTPA